MLVVGGGEKCGCLTFVRDNRRNWEDNKHLVLVLTVVAKLKSCMLKFNPSSAFYLCAFRSRGNTFVLAVLDA